MPPIPSQDAPSPPADWLSVRLRRALLPSWFASGLFHLALAGLVVSISQWGSCRGDFGGEEGENFRPVGLRTRPAATEQELDAQTESLPDAPWNSAPVEAVPVPLVLAEPPVPLTIPETTSTSVPLLGAGLPPSVTAHETLNDLIRPRGGAPAAAAAGGDVSGGTSFLGVKDVGRRFVYVIDRSYSMYDYGALQAAKMELLASIQKLDQTQQFQVIFYNDKYVVLQSRDQRFEMFWGDEVNRLQVRDQVAGIAPAGGTQHLPALMKAFQFNPDVVFLLTDGASDTALTAKELEDVRRRNRGGARIHCIEFGEGPRRATAGNFLEKLAAQNNGQYVYRDVTTLGTAR